MNRQDTDRTPGDMPADSASSTSNRPALAAVTGGGPHAWIMINALRDHFGDFPVIVESPEPSDVFWGRRKKMLGAMTVASMQAARIPIRLTRFGAQKIIDEMIETHGLDPEPRADQDLIHVPSVNSEACREALRQANAQSVFVVSTRMIGHATLDCVDAPFINYHSGVNPKYRGMFGGYFALANGEPENFGATVHLVDHGVDTGDILYRSHVTPDKRDNFHTYLWRIAAGSRSIVIQAIEDAANDALSTVSPDMESKQWFAPTFGGYLWTGLSRGVW